MSYALLITLAIADSYILYRHWLFYKRVKKLIEMSYTVRLEIPGVLIIARHSNATQSPEYKAILYNIPDLEAFAFRNDIPEDVTEKAKKILSEINQQNSVDNLPFEN